MTDTERKAAPVYCYIAPSGVRVVSCKPPREDKWARSWLSYALHSYGQIVKLHFWEEPLRRRRLRKKARGKT
jgi:hypothetical protein